MDTPKTILEAIEFMIDCNVHRYNRKQIAMRLRPNMRGADEEQKAKGAKAWLSNCLNPDGDQHFHPEDVNAICKITGRGDIYLNFLADEHGFERTAKKVVLDPVKEVLILRKVLNDMGRDPDREIKECLDDHQGLLKLALKKRPEEG